MLTASRAQQVGRDVRLRALQRVTATAILPLAAVWLLEWPFLDNAGAHG
ncbi:hypothetical protein [Pseudonocardia sp. ICBG1293]|nr:hypothetical protein [Pseudonocardia sp. ICBG1293]